MQTLPRKITSEGKRLFLSVNNVKLSVPWNESKLYNDDKVNVVVEKKEGSVLYSIRPQDPKFILTETNWKPVKYGISNPSN